MRVICIRTEGYDDVLTVGKEYEVSQYNHIAYHVEGVTPLVYKGRKLVAVRHRAFAPLSEIDERDLAHAEPIESTFILKEV